MNPEWTYACPLCAATEGEPCRRVPSGKKAERSHRSRIQLWNPRYKVENRALCCQCGNLRTVKAKHSFRVDDPAATRDDDDRLYPGRYWRMTGTLVCAVCDLPTVHAIIRDADLPEHRNYAEEKDYGLRQTTGSTVDALVELSRTAVEAEVNHHLDTLCAEDLLTSELVTLLTVLRAACERRAG